MHSVIISLLFIIKQEQHHPQLTIKQPNEKPQTSKEGQKAAYALKPGEGESTQVATANVLRNKPQDLSSWAIPTAFPDSWKGFKSYDKHVQTLI